MCFVCVDRINISKQSIKIKHYLLKYSKLEIQGASYPSF